MMPCLDLCTERTGSNTYAFSIADTRIMATSSDPLSLAFGYAGFLLKTTPSGRIEELLVVLTPPVVEKDAVKETADSVVELSASSQLTEIKDWTSMTMAQIADLLGVTRQTVYNRLAGAEISAAATAQLDRLYLNLKLLTDAEKKCFKRVAFSALHDGSTLSSWLQQGDDSGQLVASAFKELAGKMQPLILKEQAKPLDAEERSKVLARLDKVVPKVIYEP